MAEVWRFQLNFWDTAIKQFDSNARTAGPATKTKNRDAWIATKQWRPWLWSEANTVVPKTAVLQMSTQDSRVRLIIFLGRTGAPDAAPWKHTFIFLCSHMTKFTLMIGSYRGLNH